VAFAALALSVLLLHACRSSHHERSGTCSVRSGAYGTVRPAHGLVRWEALVEDERRPDVAPPEADEEQRPLGALAVTGFLTVTILVTWFSMYFLNMARS
jgi:hypothetical protein